jgi:hypothetical protein
MIASEVPKIMHCWPSHWLEAAIETGLAWRSPQGAYFISGGDAQMKRLERFVELILEKQPRDVEVE